MKSLIAVAILTALVAVLSLPPAALGGTSPQAAPANHPQPVNPAAANSVKAGGTTSAAEHAAKTEHHTKLDLNTASRDELMKLPGVTEATAGRIIAARPFKSVGELESKKILTAAELKSVESRLMVKKEAAPHAMAEPSKGYGKPETKGATPVTK